MVGRARLRDFLREMTTLVERADNQDRLIVEDDWRPVDFAQPYPEHYQQYLLHCDPAERFSVISFVGWRPEDARLEPRVCGAWWAFCTSWGSAGVSRWVRAA